METIYSEDSFNKTFFNEFNEKEGGRKALADAMIPYIQYILNAEDNAQPEIDKLMKLYPHAIRSAMRWVVLYDVPLKNALEFCGYNVIEE